LLKIIALNNKQFPMHPCEKQAHFGGTFCY
jgi:hypothetical protein